MTLLPSDQMWCDIIVVDGDRSYNGVLWDLADLMPAAHPGAPVFVDDCHPYDTAGITRAFNDSVKHGTIVEVQRYDSGRQVKFRSSGYCVGVVPTVPLKEPFDGCPVAKPLPNSRRVVITTLFAGLAEGMSMLNLWVRSLRETGIPDDKMLVVYVSDVKQYPEAMKTLKALRVPTLEIPSKISNKSSVTR